MNFNTALFLFLFLPFFLIGYFVAQPRWRPVIGIAASLLFYAWGEALNLVWIIGLILVNYFLALSFLSDKKSRLLFGLAVNLGALLFFKFFSAYQFDLFFGFGGAIQARTPEWFASLPFPLGLSYITFQTISYLIDVSTGKIKAEKYFWAFAFYVLMFPKLLAGPIVRYHTVAEQLPAPQIDRDQIADGVRRFLQGFIKKILIADTLARTVDAVFGLPVEALLPQYAWLGLVGYALQIYFDFSGYTDMAIGLASMMGFRFVENFNYPYIADSVSDFWRRWHISLSTWFRDYVFYPLERKRLPAIGRSINILIVFLLTGLWHGVTLKFIAWGFVHGIFLLIENLFLNRWLLKAAKPFRHMYALSAILFTWLIFRLPSPEYLGGYLFLLAGKVHDPLLLAFHDTTPLPFIEPSFLLAMAFGIVFSLPVGVFIQNKAGNSVTLTIARDLILLALFVLAVGVMASSSFLPSIYANF